MIGLLVIVIVVPGDRPDSGMGPVSLTSPALAGGCVTTSPTWEAQWDLCLLFDVSSATQSCQTLPETMDSNPSGSSVHGISRQECWSGLPFPSPCNLPNPGTKPEFPASPALGGRFFITEPLGKPWAETKSTCRLQVTANNGLLSLTSLLTLLGLQVEQFQLLIYSFFVSLFIKNWFNSLELMTQKITCAPLMTGHSCISIWINGAFLICFIRSTNGAISPHSGFADYMTMFSGSRMVKPNTWNSHHTWITS